MEGQPQEEPPAVARDPDLQRDSRIHGSAKEGTEAVAHALTQAQAPAESMGPTRDSRD